MERVFENSHFIKIELSGDLWGGVIESAVPSDDNAIFTVNFIGLDEYFDKINAVSSHLAGDTSISLSPDKDIGWSKFFYAGSAEGVLYEALQNLKQSMSAVGYNSSLLNIDGVRSAAMSRPSGTSRSYRLNTFEYPSMQSVMRDVLDDDSIMPLRVRVNNGTGSGSTFSFVMGFYQSVQNVSISDANNVFEINDSDGDVVRRSFSIATGSDLEDTSRYERVSFENDVAYSSMALDHPSERSGTIRRAAQRNIARERANSGTFGFSMFLEDVRPSLLDRVSLSLGDGRTLTGFVTEINADGRNFQYAVQTYLEGVSGFSVASTLQKNYELRSVHFKKPSDDLRRTIFNPLDSANRLSKKNSSARPNSTNWRT